MSTSMNIHGFTRIEARAGSTEGSPLIVEFRKLSPSGYVEFAVAEITAFTYDQILTDRIAAAINEVCKARAAELRPVPVVTVEEYDALIESESAARESQAA